MGEGHRRCTECSRFWEKPDPALASALGDRGCYWNSFVMVARVSALLSLIRFTVPELFDHFSHAVPVIGTSGRVGRRQRSLQPFARGCEPPGRTLPR